LNDLRPCLLLDDKINHTKHLIRSQSFIGTTTDNDQVILKPLPFTHQQQDPISKKKFFSFFFI
jgi:hypothetical protein